MCFVGSSRKIYVENFWKFKLFVLWMDRSLSKRRNRQEAATPKEIFLYQVAMANCLSVTDTGSGLWSI